MRVSGVQGNTAANGNWVVKAAGSTFLTLLASAGDGIYTSGGTVIPLTGACNFSSNWSLGPSSPYRAGVTRVAPTTDLSTAGQGPALDGTDVGVNISALNSAIGVAAGRFSGAASDCSFTIDTGSAHHSTAGGSTMLYVIASAPSCKWSIGNAPDWITFSPTAGIGTGRVMAKVSPNPGGLRRASLLIGGQPFSVSQDAP